MTGQLDGTCLKIEDFDKCPDEVIIREGARLRSDDRKYVPYLNENAIKSGRFTTLSVALSAYIGNKFIGVLILISLAASFAFGVIGGCNSVSSVGCQNTVHMEVKTIFRERPAPPILSSRDTREKSLIERDQMVGDWFSLPSFQATIIVSAFLLAFSRWMIENRQAAMSELFGRKKEVNLLLLKDEDGVFQPLVSAAVRPAPEGPTGTERFDKEDIWRLLQRAAVDPGRTGPEPVSGLKGVIARAKDLLTDSAEEDDKPKNAEFLRQMFVYIELDNFELAFNRYTAGLLDPEQMYRAFEIMGSRCLNRTFRYMATDQGLKYYTDSFHKALVAAIVRAEFLDQGPLDG